MNLRRALVPIAWILAVSLYIGILSSSPSQTSNKGPDYKNPQLPVEQRITDLLSRMTLEEKVAQTQALGEKKALIMDDHGDFSAIKAQEVLNHGIGEIAVPSENRSPKETAVFTNAIQEFLLKHTRLGIPAICHEESLHGYMASGATSFPQAIALASTWDVNLVEKVFGVAAVEIRARGAHQALSPVLDVARDPRWGRTEETYGEDPYLVSRLGVACIRGFQGKGPFIDNRHVIATTKHFAVYGQPEGGENTAPGNYSERIVREVFLPPFQAAITEAGAMSVMASYNEIDGIPSHANHWLLDRILRQEWGFGGFVVSDYGGIPELVTLHHAVKSKRDAAKEALAAGVDMELPDADSYATLEEQVREGRISEATLDRAVARILRAKFLLGLFDDPYVDPDGVEQVTNTPEHRALALQAAREGIILLKNQDGLLPLDRSKIKSLAVIGPNAAICHLGGYSQDPGKAVSLLAGIQNKVGNRIRVLYSLGCEITLNDQVWRSQSVDRVELPNPAEDERRITEAVGVARQSDVVLLALGGNEQTCREAWPEHLGDRNSLDLIGKQNDLTKAILATGKPTIVILINGRPLSINYIAEHVPAILEGWYLGEETGNAIADVLFGDYNPAGRLPITFPRSVGDLPEGIPPGTAGTAFPLRIRSQLHHLQV
jgi:beta-glucosidase